jgi:DNA polymerase (family 10)
LARTEEEVYRSLGLDPIPPEIREGQGEIETARQGRLPDLVREEDIRGLIHVHTTWSDGRASLEQMVEAARDRGYEYIGICDHSRSAFYARGLDVDRLREQREEIEAIAPSYPEIRILHGCEVDIRADGSLDYPDDILRWLDFTVASIHSGLDMAEEDQMRRVLRALENPHVTMLGHPSARLLLSREPIRISLPSIVEVAAKRGVALEINANPRRLDLDWRLLRAAKSAGARFSINPDAHSIRGISDITYGVGIARKGYLEKDDLVNAKSVEGFL